jgi:hypothetical protein
MSTIHNPTPPKDVRAGKVIREFVNDFLGKIKMKMAADRIEPAAIAV